MLALVFRYQVDRGVDFEKIVPALRRQFMSSMKTFGRRAGKRLGRIMRSGQYEKNSPPWIAIKKSRRPLYHTGHMSTTIQDRVIPGVGDVFVSIEVGWLDRANHPRGGGAGRSVQEIVGILTKGAEWTPDNLSKAAFWAQVPSEWKKTHFSITEAGIWKIPARDFMSRAVRDPELQTMFMQYVAKASDRVMRRRGRS